MMLYSLHDVIVGLRAGVKVVAQRLIKAAFSGDRPECVVSATAAATAP